MLLLKLTLIKIILPTKFTETCTLLVFYGRLGVMCESTRVCVCVCYRYLEYETNRTMFYTGDAQPQNVSRKIALTNVFNRSLVLFNITLSNDIRHVFTVCCHHGI